MTDASRATGAGPTPAAPQFSASCPTCGAQTAYAPGTTVLRCGSCGAEIAIAPPEVEIEEHSYDQWQARNGGLRVATIAGQVLRCRGCGASTETSDLAGACQFCGGALVAVAEPPGVVAPEAVVPFHLDRSAAHEAFGAWVRSRRFAPNALRRVGSTEGLTGTYLPHWTYDTHTETDYTGKRGEHYWVTVTSQVPDGNGGTRTESHQEMRTRWYSAAGHVRRDFDDVLVPGTERFDTDRLEKMGPWRLGEARPFQPDYLAGYSALRYDVDPDVGAARAREQMVGVIREDCRADIGGDEQRVDRVDVTYSQNMFKLVLLPLWIATYLYGGKSWQVMVNANTGEVVGERPWSVPKIAAAVLAALVLVGVVVALVMAGRTSG